MSNVYNRTTGEYLRSVNTPDYPVEDWIINPNLSALSSVPKKYWKVVGDMVVEMLQAEKDAVDAILASAATTQKQAEIKDQILSDPLNGLTVSVSASGLVITVNIDTLIDNEQITIIADSIDTKYIKICYVYNENTDNFNLNVYEKTTGIYADLTIDEYLIRDMKEFSVIANGTDLIEVV